MRILQVSAHDGGPACGVFDHATRLTEQLIADGHSVQLMRPEQLDAVAEYDIIHLHYVPFLYARWGLGALPLARRLLRIAPLVVTIHEPRIRYGLSLRGVGLAAAQDLFLQTLSKIAGAVIVSTSRWLPFVRFRTATVIPSGSVLPLQSVPQSAHRRRVTLIASGHWARMHDLAVQAAKAVAKARGFEIEAIGVARSDDLPYTGYLPPEQFAAHLAESELVVLPFLDGVTGRRTSFISAAQVGVPTLTTLTSPMDDFTVDGAFEHAPPDQPGEFIARAVDLAGDDSRRERLGRKARELYERELSWNVIGPRVMAVYQSTLK
jgi:glycosyltransferase involved in cell wall biosynthesis